MKSFLLNWFRICLLTAVILALALFPTVAAAAPLHQERPSLLGEGRFLFWQSGPDVAIAYFEKAASTAELRNDHAAEIDAYVGLAAASYAAGQQDQLEHYLELALSIVQTGQEQVGVQRRIIGEIALHEAWRQIIYSDSYLRDMVTTDDLYTLGVYGMLEDDIDGDGDMEIVTAGGTTSFWGIGVAFLFDWQDGRLQHHVLVGPEEGFENLGIADVNQDSRLEVLVLWRWGTGAYLHPFVLTYDGQTVQFLFSWQSVGAKDAYHQGDLDFKDMDADGTDELIIWRSTWDGTGECQWCPHNYEIQVWNWDGQRYSLARRSVTEGQYDPGMIAGISANRFNFLGGSIPIDVERNLMVESMRAELADRQASGTVSVDFVVELLARSESFWWDDAFTEAEVLADLAVEASNSLPDRNVRDLSTADALSYRGSARRDQGRRLEAEEDFRQAIELLERMLAEHGADEVSIKERLMHLHNDAGANFYHYGLQSALYSFSRSAEIADELDDLETKSAAFSNSGVIYFFLGDFERALSHFTQALTWDEQMENLPGQIFRHRSIGSIFLVVGDIEQAIGHFQTALDIALQLGDHYSAAQCYLEIGRSYYELGQYQRAFANLERSLLLSPSDLIRELDGLVYLYLGDVYAAQGEPQWAEAYYRKVLATDGAGTLISPYGVFWRAHYGLARLARQQNQNPQTLEHLQLAVGAIERERSAITIESLSTQFQNNRAKLAVYSDLITLLSTLGRRDEAFNTAERARGRSLLDQIGNQRADFGQGAAPELIEREQALRQQIIGLQNALGDELSKPFEQQSPPLLDELTQDLEGARRDYDALITRLKLESPEYASLLSVDTLTLDEVQSQVLDEHTTLVEYFVLDEQVLAWVVDREGFELVSLEVARDDLRSQVEFLRQLIARRDFDAPTAGQLYDTLFAPLKPHLRHANLVIVPHGVLHYLPFAALWDAKNGRYLAHDYALTYAPSASVLQFILDKRNADEGRLLALGNPDGSLPRAETETEVIAELFGTTPLLGGQAVESQVHAQAGQLDVLHLAAHGVYNPFNPLFTRIELAPDGTHDGYLEVHEVFGLDLTEANLVVLSACETALGEQSEGDELVGLTRAFLYAGTPSVVTTLWSIDDAASGFLMESFYRHLRDGLTNAEALRAAQLQVLAEYGWQTPYYWAAFSLTGDYRGSGEPRMVMEETLEPTVTAAADETPTSMPVVETPTPEGDGGRLCGGALLPLGMAMLVGAYWTRGHRRARS